MAIDFRLAATQAYCCYELEHLALFCSYGPICVKEWKYLGLRRGFRKSENNVRWFALSKTLQKKGDALIGSCALSLFIEIWYFTS